MLERKDFYGYNPFKIPFVGQATGDIDKIYVNNKQVNFKLDEQIYFKQRIYLDGGYNRVPVKIIDKRGNITKSFIPITIEQTYNNIDIDNEIYNY